VPAESVVREVAKLKYDPSRARPSVQYAADDKKIRVGGPGLDGQAIHPATLRRACR
jgi:hypothetical protein